MKFTNLYIYPDDDTALFSDYCIFNQIEHSNVDLWDEVDLSFVITPELIFKNNCCLIVGQKNLLDLSKSEKTYDSVVKFCQNNTLFAAKDTGDGFMLFDDRSFVGCLKKLNTQVPAGSIKFILDSTMTQDCFLRDLTNIVWVDYPTLERVLSTPPRITDSSVEKHLVTHDFLLTTILKESRPHRAVLANELAQRKDLFDRGLCNIHPEKNSYQHWLGKKSTEHAWHDNYPSMDLYSRAWIELVPETCHENFHYITEKTTKTFVTKTPALFVSTQGYLKFLRESGFRTFGELIDESYDEELNLELRIKKVVDTLEDIVAAGAEGFYRASLPILEHNQKRYFELSGSWIYTTDLFIRSHFGAD